MNPLDLIIADTYMGRAMLITHGKLLHYEPVFTTSLIECLCTDIFVIHAAILRG